MPRRPPNPRRPAPSRPRPGPAPTRKPGAYWPWVAGAIALALLGVVLAMGVWSRLTVPPRDVARDALADGRAAAAERALVRATQLDPTDPIPWRFLLELLRLEDRRHDARRVGEAALKAVGRPARRDILKALTLALLADVPDDSARAALRKFVAADPDDIDARVALIRRIAADPRPDDPGAAERLAALETALAGHPGHIPAREALIEALADAGDPERGRAILAAWPEAERDARYHRLAARWALEFDREPALALDRIDRALADWPHDWKARYLRTRTLQALGRADEATREAENLGRLRELLEPQALGHRLDEDIARLDEPAARRDLADLCGRIGLEELATAWRRDADEPPPLGPLPIGGGPGLAPGAGPR